jgi:hypothetical protein
MEFGELIVISDDAVVRVKSAGPVAPEDPVPVGPVIPVGPVLPTAPVGPVADAPVAPVIPEGPSKFVITTFPPRLVIVPTRDPVGPRILRAVAYANRDVFDISIIGF